jgi:hypothetical protein
MKTSEPKIIPGPYRVCSEKHDNGTLIIRSDPKGDGDVPGDLVVALIVGGAPDPYDHETATLLASAWKLREALEEIEREASGALNNAMPEDAPNILDHIKGIAARALSSNTH